jgi:peptidoglycan/xylan/chitin deacetylase (PgdA/CDA1 family)
VAERPARLRVEDINDFRPGRDLIGYGSIPPRVVWPDQAAVAVSFVINYEEGAEYSYPMGDARNDVLTETPNYTLPDRRDLGAESMFEYGSRAGIHRLMRLFREYELATTFYASAVALEKNPEVGRQLVEDGHEPCSHGWRWEETWVLSRDDERERIRQTIESFERICGRRCVGAYHRYAPSLNTRELLVEEGFLYDSDSYADDLPYFTKVSGKDHLVVPYTLVYNDARFVLSQGFSNVGDFVDLVIRALEDLRREAAEGYPKMISIGLHPRLIGVPGRVSAIREMIEHMLDRGDCWITTREAIAKWWIDHQAEWQAS